MSCVLSVKAGRSPRLPQSHSEESVSVHDGKCLVIDAFPFHILPSIHMMMNTSVILSIHNRHHKTLFLHLNTQRTPSFTRGHRSNEKEEEVHHVHVMMYGD